MPADLDGEPLSPSELPPQDGRVRVGGRARTGASGQVFLCDAFSAIAVSLEPQQPVSDGELLVVEGTWASGAIFSATVLQRHAGQPGASAARFAQGGVGRWLRERANALTHVRRLFRERGFVEVETPAMVECPGLDLHLSAFEIEGAARYLTTSPEYHMKRLLVAGVPRCFQLGRAFRRGEAGGRHNPEFTMLEWYRSFAGYDAVMADTELVVAEVVAALANARHAPALSISPPFERLTVTRAFERFAKTSEPEMLRLAHEDQERFFRLLVDQVEPALEATETPIFLHRYPANMASLARLCPDDPRYAERFELYFRGLELCNGFGELCDPREQRRRFERDQRDRAEANLPVYPLDEAFLAALEEGLPPSAGNALGIDRLIMLALGTASIGDVIAFPEGLR